MAEKIFIAKESTSQEIKDLSLDLQNKIIEINTKIGNDTDESILNTLFAKLNKIEESIGSSSGSVKKVQRGTTTQATTVTIEEVNMDKTVVISYSKGSAGYVAARGNMNIEEYSFSGSGKTYDLRSGSSGGSYASGSYSIRFTGDVPSHKGTITGGTTDLTVKVYSAKLISSTQLQCDGAVEWQVIEYY